MSLNKLIGMVIKQIHIYNLSYANLETIRIENKGISMSLNKLIGMVIKQIHIYNLSSANIETIRIERATSIHNVFLPHRVNRPLHTPQFLLTERKRKNSKEPKELSGERERERVCVCHCVCEAISISISFPFVVNSPA